MSTAMLAVANGRCRAEPPLRSRFPMVGMVEGRLGRRGRGRRVWALRPELNSPVAEELEKPARLPASTTNGQRNLQQGCC